MSARTSNAGSSQPAAFRDPNDTLALALSARLQREIDAFERQLEQLLGREADARGQPVDVWRRAIRSRRAMLADLSAATGSATPALEATLRDRPLRD